MQMDLSDIAAKRGGGGGGGGGTPGSGGKRGALASRRASRPAKSPVLARPSGDGNNRVYVHNLPFEVSWQDLKDHMKAAGPVTRADIITKADGSSKGCGLVEFATPKGAATAIRTLNDSVLQGRQILVREDREAGGGAGAGKAAPAGGRAGGGGGNTNRRLYVGNLPFRVTWEELKDSFRKFGEVAYANVSTNPDGRSKGWGVVEMANGRDARAAIAATIVFDGRSLEVREDREAAGSVASVAAGGGAAGAGGPRRALGGGSGAAKGSRVYVGNLSWDVAWQDLKDLFKTVGEVVHADVFTGSDGRSRGCGIVEFASPADASHAIATLNDTELKGRLIFVREDREEEGFSGGAAAAGAGRGAAGAGAGRGGAGAGTRVYVGNVPFNLTWQQLKDTFAEVAPIVRADIPLHPDGKSKGFGIVVFETPAGADKAIETFTGALMDGRPIEVRLDRE